VGAGCLRKNPHWVRVEDEAEVIEEVAGFAQHASAALGEIGIPMFRVQFPGIDAEAGRLRTRAGGERFLKLQAGRGETAVEPDLEGALTLLIGSVNLTQFIQRKAERLFDEDVPAPSQGGDHERRVQVMASGDQHCGRRIASAEQFGGVRGGFLEVELRLDMAGAEGRLINDAPECQLLFQVRKQHGPGKVARADHVHAGDGRSDSPRAPGKAWRGLNLPAVVMAGQAGVSGADGGW